LNFQDLDERADFDAFDVVMEQLYDWADWDKRLWIKTF